MSQPRVLVTGVGSNIGQGIVKAVRRGYPDAYILGVDMVPDNAGSVACTASARVPRADDNDYVECIASLLSSHSIDIALIGSNAEPAVLARARDELEAASGAVVVVSGSELVDRCTDKLETARYLTANGRQAPLSTGDLDEAMAIGFPLIAKPRGGNASAGIAICDDADQLAVAFANIEAPVAQQYIGDPREEYTVAVLGDREGEVAAILPMRRRLQHGTTVDAEFADFPIVEREARAVAELLGPVGPINIQMRLDGERAVTFEINPRFSGTTAMRALAGWNDAAATVAHFTTGAAIELAPPRSGRVLRFYDEVWVGSDGEVTWQTLAP